MGVVVGKEVNIPALSHRTRQGWGTLRSCYIGVGPVLLGDNIPGFPGQVSAARLQVDRGRVRREWIGRATRR